MSRTILVVDDDPGMRETMRDILEDEGYRVEVAGNGREALAALDGMAPAAVLLDMAMPVMDGAAFAEELGRRGLRGTIPLIVVTADGRAPEKAARVGAEGSLMKPFTLPTLLAEVARVIGA